MDDFIGPPVKAEGLDIPTGKKSRKQPVTVQLDPETVTLLLRIQNRRLLSGEGYRTASRSGIVTEGLRLLAEKEIGSKVQGPVEVPSLESFLKYVHNTAEPLELRMTKMELSFLLMEGTNPKRQEELYRKALKLMGVLGQELETEIQEHVKE
jgi:hypothetical protein